MTDKNWMLNPTAISQARECIAIIQAELGIKLKLSHPQFLEMICEYIELTDSDKLAKAYATLSSSAGDNIPSLTSSVVSTGSKVVNIAKAEPAKSNSTNSTSDEMVDYRGKQYPRYSESGEFKGLYRGQAHYA